MLFDAKYRPLFDNKIGASIKKENPYLEWMPSPVLLVLLLGSMRTPLLSVYHAIICKKALLVLHTIQKAWVAPSQMIYVHSKQLINQY